MNTRFKHFLMGLSSAFVIMPAGAVSEIPLNRQSDQDNLTGDWQRIGADLKTAMRQVDHAQKETASHY